VADGSQCLPFSELIFTHGQKDKAFLTHGHSQHNRTVIHQPASFRKGQKQKQAEASAETGQTIFLKEH
jgi:hypothetical protein